MSSFFWSFMGIKNRYKLTLFRSSHPWTIPRNNTIIENFLRSPCDILVKMDVDQVYPQDYFEKMVPLVDEYKVIGPLIFDRWRHNDFMPLAYQQPGGYGTKLQLMDMDDLSGGIVEVPYCHTNLFYAKEVFEKISPPWYEAYYNEKGTGKDNHVDYSLLSKIMAAGYKIYLNTDIVVNHLTTQGVDRDLYDRWHRRG
jgi:hypothetical protein